MAVKRYVSQIGINIPNIVPGPSSAGTGQGAEALSNLSAELFRQNIPVLKEKGAKAGATAGISPDFKLRPPSNQIFDEAYNAAGKEAYFYQLKTNIKQTAAQIEGDNLFDLESFIKEFDAYRDGLLSNMDPGMVDEASLYFGAYGAASEITISSNMVNRQRESDALTISQGNEEEIAAWMYSLRMTGEPDKVALKAINEKYQKGVNAGLFTGAEQQTRAKNIEYRIRLNTAYYELKQLTDIHAEAVDFDDIQEQAAALDKIAEFFDDIKSETHEITEGMPYADIKNMVRDLQVDKEQLLFHDQIIAKADEAKLVERQKLANSNYMVGIEEDLLHQDHLAENGEFDALWKFREKRIEEIRDAVNKGTIDQYQGNDRIRDIMKNYRAALNKKQEDDDTAQILHDDYRFIEGVMKSDRNLSMISENIASAERVFLNQLAIGDERKPTGDEGIEDRKGFKLFEFNADGTVNGEDLDKIANWVAGLGYWPKALLGTLQSTEMSDQELVYFAALFSRMLHPEENEKSAQTLREQLPIDVEGFAVVLGQAHIFGSGNIESLRKLQENTRGQPIAEHQQRILEGQGLSLEPGETWEQKWGEYTFKLAKIMTADLMDQEGIGFFNRINLELSRTDSSLGHIEEIWGSWDIFLGETFNTFGRLITNTGVHEKLIIPANFTRLAQHYINLAAAGYSPDAESQEGVMETAKNRLAHADRYGISYSLGNMTFRHMPPENAPIASLAGMPDGFAFAKSLMIDFWVFDRFHELGLTEEAMWDGERLNVQQAMQDGSLEMVLKGVPHGYGDAEWVFYWHRKDGSVIPLTYHNTDTNLTEEVRFSLPKEKRMEPLLRQAIDESVIEAKRLFPPGTVISPLVHEVIFNDIFFNKLRERYGETFFSGNNRGGLNTVFKRIADELNMTWGSNPREDKILGDGPDIDWPWSWPVPHLVGEQSNIPLDMSGADWDISLPDDPDMTPLMEQNDPVPDVPATTKQPSPQPSWADEFVMQDESVMENSVSAAPNFSISFESGSNKLLGHETALSSVADRLEQDQRLELQLIAYTPEGDSTAEARRLSLMRALAVRSYLKKLGISGRRINVRAEIGSGDRVEFIMSEAK